MTMRTNRIQPTLLSFLSPLLAIAAALVVGAGLIVLAGKNSVAAYGALFQFHPCWLRQLNCRLSCRRHKLM